MQRWVTLVQLTYPHKTKMPTAGSDVRKLNQIQRKYSDSDIKTTPCFNGCQLDVVKAIETGAFNSTHMERIAEYVGEMWMGNKWN